MKNRVFFNFYRKNNKKIKLFILLFFITLSFFKKRPSEIALISTQLRANPFCIERPISARDTPLLSEILEADFTFLGKGKQSISYSEPSGEYVLKFFKTKRLEIEPWIRLLAFLPFAHTYHKKICLKKGERMSAIFKSCKIAYEELKEETGLIYIHMHQGDHFEKWVSLMDQQGKKRRINLANYLFCVQKRAQPLYRAIEEKMVKEEEAGARELLSHLIDKIKARHQRGIIDYDPCLANNSGSTLEGQVIFMDIGRFDKCDWVRNSENGAKILKEVTADLKQWLSDCYPSLYIFLESNISS